MEKMLEAVPPHDNDAEKAVLGSMMIDSRAADIAIEELRGDDFYLPRHRTLFKALAELFQKNENLDELFVTSSLQRQGILDAVGGKETIGQLVMDTPNAGNIETYCEVVRDRAIERELLDGAGKILKMVREPQSSGSSELVEQAEGIVYDIADKRTSEDAVSMQTLMQDALSDASLVQAAKREGRDLPSPALPTTFAELDRLLSGGLWPGELIVIAGRPSMGKTTFAINIARRISVAREDRAKATAVFSLEMPREQVAKNIICAEAQLSGHKMRRYDFNEDEYAIFESVNANLQRAPLYIDDTSALSVSALRARCRRLRHRHDIRMIVVDYLQLMRGSPNKNANREQEVSEISRGLKAVARDLKVPVIVLSQLNRSAEKRENEDKRPQLSDLRESGAIEQDADVVIMLYRPEYYDIERNAKAVNVGEALVLKNRNGSVGKCQLTFFKDQLRFETYLPEHEALSAAAGE